MKIKKLGVIIGIVGFVLAGCGAANDKDAAANVETPDVVTTASIVNERAAFINAIGREGNWIVAILNDLSIDQEIVVSGEFRDKGDANNEIYRKIALYAQDENKNITASYTLTVPKLTVESENLRIQGGTVKGSVYVAANGFNLHETATVDGNIEFASEAVKATAKIDGKVSGTIQ